MPLRMHIIPSKMVESDLRSPLNREFNDFRLKVLTSGGQPAKGPSNYLKPGLWPFNKDTH